jgi:hypothetical protein
VRASFAGDDLRQPASAEVTLELVDASTTTMRLSSTSLAFEDALEVDGAVTDSDGKPVPRAAVYLMAGDRRLASGATGPDGRYHFEIEAEVIEQGETSGQFALQTQADPGSTSIKPSHSAPVIVKIAAPQPVPVSYTIAAFVATLFAAAGFFLARSKPWRHLRRPAPAAEASPPAALDGVEATGGLVANRPGMMSTLRRPTDDGFTGVVRDTGQGAPVGTVRSFRSALSVGAPAKMSIGSVTTSSSEVARTVSVGGWPGCAGSSTVTASLTCARDGSMIMVSVEDSSNGPPGKSSWTCWGPVVAARLMRNLPSGVVAVLRVAPPSVMRTCWPPSPSPVSLSSSWPETSATPAPPQESPRSSTFSSWTVVRARTSTVGAAVAGIAFIVAAATISKAPRRTAR